MTNISCYKFPLVIYKGCLDEWHTDISSYQTKLITYSNHKTVSSWGQVSKCAGFLGWPDSQEKRASFRAVTVDSEARLQGAVRDAPQDGSGVLGSWGSSPPLTRTRSKAASKPEVCQVEKEEVRSTKDHEGRKWKQCGAGVYSWGKNGSQKSLPGRGELHRLLTGSLLCPSCRGLAQWGTWPFLLCALLLEWAVVGWGKGLGVLGDFRGTPAGLWK